MRRVPSRAGEGNAFARVAAQPRGRGRAAIKATLDHECPGGAPVSTSRCPRVMSLALPAIGMTRQLDRGDDQHLKRRRRRPCGRAVRPPRPRLRPTPGGAP